MEIALAVGGALLSPAFQVILDKLTSLDLLNYASQGHVLDELKKWERMLKKIYAVLDDAEEKQMTSQSVKIWASELRDLAYDVEDILDEFDTEARRRKLVAASIPSTSKMRKLIPTCCTGLSPSTVKFNAEIISKMERITVRLEDIMKEKDFLHLEEGNRGKTSRAKDRSAATSLVNEAQVYGRERDKKAILKLLKAETNNTSQICILPIVGMGGIGKTTLAQLVFNDATLVFDFKAWVSVGEVFDVHRITKTILQSKDCDGEDLNSLQVKLKEKLSRNKFLIVLDDVWTENYDDWTLFRSPFETGVPGSRIIITTRSEAVSLKTGTIPPYYLQKLSYDDCLSIFVYHALGAQHLDDHLDLREIGEEIAKKCQGLPLAAKTLGGLLRGKPNANVWMEVLRSKIWDLPKDNGILPALRLSYNHLPPHLKRCFAHCAIFPKDYKFYWLDLVLLWMAEGLLQQSKINKKMEDIGLDYFNELLSRSFFEECSDGSFMMHDLMSDLAHFVAGQTVFDLTDDLGGSQLSANIDKVRHLTWTDWTKESLGRLEVLSKMKHLRTFVLTSDWYGGFTDVVLNNLLLELKCLRVLSLHRTHITQLPNSVGQLNHLRFLNLSRTDIKCLPESVGALLNLQTLILSGCEELRKLPQGIKNLTNLHNLDITSTPNLKEMPAGIGNLTSLQSLHKFIVGKGDGLRVNELRHLDLHGKLSVRKLDNVVDTEDAKVANLNSKLGLVTLDMEWSDDFNDSRNERDETLVLELLQPPKILEKLTIAFFGGTRFPMWLGDDSFVNLLQLHLVGCRSSISLPSLGQLPSLRRLFVEGAERVKTVGVEFYGHHPASSKSFQFLEILQFENMMDWEHWTCREAHFPCLVQLELWNCPKLMGELPDNLLSLEHLHIVGCPELKDSLITLPSLSTLYIEQCNQAILRRVLSFRSLTCLHLCRISGFGCLSKRIIRAVTALKVLKVKDCTDLIVLWEGGSEMQRMTSLKRVVIEKCPNLRIFAKGDKGMPCSLEFLVLEKCENLETLPDDLHSLASLADLRIRSCPKFKFPVTGLPQSLTYLRFGDLHNEEENLMHEEELHETSEVAYHTFAAGTYQPSREEGKMRIHVSDSRELKSLLQSMVGNNIKHIYIPVCLNLKCLGELKHNLINLRGLTVTGCTAKKPSTMSEWGLSSLSSLQRLEISQFEMVSFPDDDGCLLPTSLKHVSVCGIGSLESISRGILNLTCLERLEIGFCNKISSLPKDGLPASLQNLDITHCPALDERCKKEKGEYWSFISKIPESRIINDENDPNVCVIQ